MVGITDGSIKISTIYIFIIIILIIKFKVLSNPIQKQALLFLFPFPYYTSFPSEYKWSRELLIPQSSPFIKTNDLEFYKTWNGEALINFKWRMFGKIYYALIWSLYLFYLYCFMIASTSSGYYRGLYSKLTIVLGFLQLTFEIRQIIWNYKKWLLNIWNLFGMYDFLFLSNIISK